MIKRSHIRQFLAIVEAGSFTQAAARIRVTQPTLSSGIAELERLVGTQLFVRDRKRVRMTESGARLLPIARDLMNDGIRVNTIAPGWIVPHTNEDIAEGSFWNRLDLGTPEGMQQAMDARALFNMSNMPIRRLGRPEDMANLTMFLASEASSYITGQLISVSGGVYMP